MIIIELQILFKDNERRTFCIEWEAHKDNIKNNRYRDMEIATIEKITLIID